MEFLFCLGQLYVVNINVVIAGISLMVTGGSVAVSYMKLSNRIDLLNVKLDNLEALKNEK